VGGGQFAPGPDVLARDEVQPLGVALAGVVGLLARGQEHLHPETDAQKRFTGLGGVDECLAERPGVVHPLGEGAHAGQDDAVGGVDRPGVVDEVDGRAGAFETAGHAPEVSQAVVDHDHLGRGLSRAHTRPSWTPDKSLSLGASSVS